MSLRENAVIHLPVYNLRFLFYTGLSTVSTRLRSFLDFLIITFTKLIISSSEGLLKVCVTFILPSLKYKPRHIFFFLKTYKSM